MTKLEIAKELVKLFEIIACITGFIYWNKLKSSHWKWLPVYLAAIILVEITGSFLENTKVAAWNIYLFKFIGFPLQFLFFIWLFYKERVIPKKLIAISSLLFYLLTIGAEEFLLAGKKLPFFSLSYLAGCIILLIGCILYFSKLIRSESILFFKQDIMFWVCLGIVVFYIATFPYYGLFYTLAQKKYRYIHLAYTWASCFLDYLMYIFFTIGFICYKPKQK